MKIPTKLLKTLIFGMGIFCMVNVAQAGTLENLERERAFLIKTFLDPDLAAGARLKKIEMSKPRLIDLERMVLRDDSLTGRNTPVVRKAFSNYDLTFLIHAAAEKNRTPVDIWLEQVGLSTSQLLVAEVVPAITD